MTIRLIANGRRSSDGSALYEIEPRPMSIDQLTAAATKYLKKELPKRTSRDAANQWRMEQKARLFGGTLEMHGWSDEDLKPPLDKPIIWNAELAGVLIQRATTAKDGEADKVLRDAQDVFLDRDVALPSELRSYTRKPFNGRRGNQPLVGRFGPRDRAISYCIQQILRHSSVEIEATRNVATAAESACSIMVQAYRAATGKTLTESSMNSIWGRLHLDYEPSTVTARPSQAK